MVLLVLTGQLHCLVLGQRDTDRLPVELLPIQVAHGCKGEDTPDCRVLQFCSDTNPRPEFLCPRRHHTLQGPSASLCSLPTSLSHPQATPAPELPHSHTPRGMDTFESSVGREESANIKALTTPFIPNCSESDPAKLTKLGLIPIGHLNQGVIFLIK